MSRTLYTKVAASISKHRKRSLACAIGAIVVVVLLIGGYGWGWGWTGFADSSGQVKTKTVWDWMQLLLIPVALAVASLWFNARQKQREHDQIEEQRERDNRLADRQRREAQLRQLHTDFIQAYNAAKAVRRLLRATARCLPSAQDDVKLVAATGKYEDMIMLEPYDKHMQELTRVQLQFETLRDEVASNYTIFPRTTRLNEDLVTILTDIEEYLGHIITEYENHYRTPPSADHKLPISSLPRLNEFIKTFRYAVDFRVEFQMRVGQVMTVLHELLTSESEAQQVTRKTYILYSREGNRKVDLSSIGSLITNYPDLASGPQEEDDAWLDIGKKTAKSICWLLANATKAPQSGEQQEKTTARIVLPYTAFPPETAGRIVLAYTAFPSKDQEMPTKIEKTLAQTCNGISYHCDSGILLWPHRSGQ